MRARDARILLIDDHPLFRAGVRSTLAHSGLAVQWHEVASVQDALAALAEQMPFDLILYDWHLRGGGGVKGLVAVLQTAPAVPLLVITADEDEAIRMAAASLGAVECVSKAADPRRISDLLWRWLNHAHGPAAPGEPHAASPGAAQLTHRQHEVLALMAQGDTNKRIADKLRIAQTTVRAHVSDILRMLKAHNRTEAVVVATRSGLLDGWTHQRVQAASAPDRWS
jgi:DNA-binding NarL/FixJ family response regulator